MRSKRHRRLRTHKLQALLITLIVLVALGGATDVGYASVKTQADRLQTSLTRDLEAGQSELEAGKTALQQANAKRDTNLVNQAVADFVAAKADFQSAADQADNSRFLRYIEYVPSVGQLARSRHTAVDGIAQMGAAISDAGRGLSQLDAEILAPKSSGQAGHTLLTVLDQVHAGLASIRAYLQEAQTAAARVDISVVPAAQQAAFVKARQEIDSALSGFREFERLYPVLTEVLGGNGARTYLVEQVDSAELRAGGGFIGTYSLVRADHGSLQVIRSGDAYDLVNPRPLPGQSGFIPQPGPFREIIPNISWSFVDTNQFPDFPTSAVSAEKLLQGRIGSIDGIVSIDYYAVAKMLDLTGPLAVPGYALTVNSSNFVDQLVRLTVAGNPAHKAILAALAGPLMGRIAALPSEQWAGLIGALNSLAAQRHIQDYFNDPTVETEMDRVGWSGRMNPSAAPDYFMQIEDNYKGGKADYFLTRHYTIDLSRSGGVLHHKITIDYFDNYPASAQSFLTYIAAARLYTLSNASGMSDTLRSVQYPFPAPPSGFQVMTGWLPAIACCGGRAEAVFTYDSPWPSNDSAGPRIYWQKQPGVSADSFSVNWNYGDGHVYRSSGAFGQDEVISLSNAGLSVTRSDVGEAVLPSLSIGS